MKKIFFIIFLLLLAFSFPYIPSAKAFVMESVCDVPITYKIGTVDTRFSLSSDEFLKDVESAEQVWEEPIGKNLYQYDSKGTLTINLIYDERQALHSQIDTMEGNLENGKSSLDTKTTEYTSMVSAFRKKLADLNDEISYWNNKGGAPRDVYDQLIQKQQEIKTEADKLNAIARSLNIQTQEYNTGVSSLNQTVDTFNQVLQGKPEEGLYKPAQNQIDIYFNFDHNELVHTLAHELGHARRLNHLPGARSIMYSFTSKSTIVSSDDLTAMQAVCKKNYMVEVLRDKLEELALKMHDLRTKTFNR